MAGIIRLVIAVITTLAGADNAVTTAVEAAIGFAGICIDLVAIVTGLVARLAVGQAPAKKTVSATAFGTVVQAGIVIGPIAVVTGFVRLDQSVTAARELAGIGAPIEVFFIAIIAVLDTPLDQGIAAASG